jgi:hypothetical protein
MKHIQLFEEFVTEKVYQMTGSYGAKGIAGKVLFAFKKEIESVKFEGDVNSTLKDINAAWSNWANKVGAKIIIDEVLKQVKDKKALTYITANLDDVWSKESIKGSELIINIPGDFIINVGFADDVDAGKFARKLGGMQNIAVSTSNSIMGSFDEQVGENNIEIRSGLNLTIDQK